MTQIYEEVFIPPNFRVKIATIRLRALHFCRNSTPGDISKAHGINGLTPEDTMRNMGLIASPGMVETEGTIVDIMRGKGSAL